jgi:hypothetical protein
MSANVLVNGGMRTRDLKLAQWLATIQESLPARPHLKYAIIYITS